jgi:UDP-N-acetylglucosamine 2-epimerase (non-hydrolysing)
VNKNEFAVLTLHRPGNVDSAETLSDIFEVLSAVCSKIRLVYPIHPRTLASLRANGMIDRFAGLVDLEMIDPLGYMDFIKLVKESKFVLTDSGSIQEETTFMRVPCLTMRENTERPLTITLGTNELVGRNKQSIVKAINRVLNGKWKSGRVPKYWDGHTTDRIIDVIAKFL